MTAVRSPVPVLGFCAWSSDAGKTTLLTHLIPLLIQRGIRISAIKHAHHRFDIDHPGKDSYRLREVGATQVLIGSHKRWALMTELSSNLPEKAEPSLQEFVQQLDVTLADLIVVEGFRQENFPKIEIHRPALGVPLLAPDDSNIIAVASDAAVSVALPVPVLDLNNPDAVADFVMVWLRSTLQESAK